MFGNFFLLFSAARRVSGRGKKQPQLHTASLTLCLKSTNKKRGGKGWYANYNCQTSSVLSFLRFCKHLLELLIQILACAHKFYHPLKSKGKYYGLIRHLYINYWSFMSIFFCQSVFIELIEDTEILLIFLVGNTSTQLVNISKVYRSS